MLRLLALVLLLPSATAAQTLDVNTVAESLLSASWFEDGISDPPKGLDAFIDAAHRAYVEAYQRSAPADLEADSLALSVGALAFNVLDLDESILATEDEEALSNAMFLGEISPSLRLADSVHVHRYLTASGYLDRSAEMKRLEAASPHNVSGASFTLEQQQTLVDAHRQFIWSQTHVLFRYVLRDVAASDLEAVIATHESPDGRDAVERSIEAVATLQPFADAMLAWSSAIFENLGEGAPAPPLVVPASH
ncbi:hypothetical protein [Rubrivirga sp.]|uniref:hypothetical protein n=1 Tax=Rubrivirga sp. TaxID=1885344 RepID=UPI003C760905